MKKLYIAPNLTCVKVELQGFIADSPHNTRIPKAELSGTESNNMTPEVVTNRDLQITAKHYDAWSTWDE